MTSMTPNKATLTVEGDRSIRVVRDFDAPARLVWRAYTEPELVRRWWHAGHGRMSECTIDLRVGGAYRFAMDATSTAQEVAFHGVFQEIVEHERLVSTEFYEGIPDGPPVLNTLTFTEADGRTQLELLMECDSPEQREGIIQSGMETGLKVALDLLEEVARTLA
jgi:uncharacterized protein YndB with AHSA1/START domain